MTFSRTIAVCSLVGTVVIAAESRAQESAGEAEPRVRVIERATSEKTDSSDLDTAELESRAKKRELGEGDYPYHDQSREVSGEVDCPDIDIVEHGGEVISYNRPVEINSYFRERLIRFEKIVRDVATEVYGRPPDRIVHYGGHDCKTVGNNGEKLSEHAFGHAIDVAGFDFEAYSGDDADDLRVERAAEAFQVRLGEHWDADDGFAAHHAEFLHRLAEVLERRGPFSTMLGPGYPGHDEIFHFDFGPEFFFRLS